MPPSAISPDTMPTTADPTPSKEVYLLDCNPFESKRLNTQHQLFLSVIGGKHIHPSIPTENIQTIADVGAGTGIWLTSLPKTFPRKQPNPKLYLHGFDISAAMFPFRNSMSPAKEIDLSVHDIRDRFAPEHRGRYDLVHVGFLICALKEEEYVAAMRNVVELLKPGGHLQWEDCTTDILSTAEIPPSPHAARMREIFHSACAKTSLCPTAAVLVEQLARQAGLEDVDRITCNAIEEPEVRELSRGWMLQLLRSMMPRSVVGAGLVGGGKGEARAFTEEMVGELEGCYGGVVPVVEVHVVVGRRALLN